MLQVPSVADRGYVRMTKKSERGCHSEADQAGETGSRLVRVVGRFSWGPRDSCNRGLLKHSNRRLLNSSECKLSERVFQEFGNEIYLTPGARRGWALEPNLA